jgi:hypothetical protein
MTYLVPGIEISTKLQVPMYNLKNRISSTTKTATRLPRYDYSAIYMIFSTKPIGSTTTKLEKLHCHTAAGGTWQSCEVVLFNILQ